LKNLNVKLIFAVYIIYYNRWHKSINWSSIQNFSWTSVNWLVSPVIINDIIEFQILIKINLEKASKLNSLDTNFWHHKILFLQLVNIAKSYLAKNLLFLFLGNLIVPVLWYESYHMTIINPIISIFDRNFDFVLQFRFRFACFG